MRPVPLLYEPAADQPDPARFFGLDEITDPVELLDRATGLATAFRAAADRAAAYQAIAAAELTDPRRFDRITYEELADQVGCTPAVAETMAERGRQILKGETVGEF
jgi:acyl-CoA synthetase (AMP-forming)/AMP-acid ligase II